MEKSTLVKFGELEHLAALRDRGEMYMNTLEFFWNVEADELRNDRYDCADKVVRGTKGTAEFKLSDGGNSTIQIDDFVYWEYTAEPATINLFCMYALRPDFGTFPVDDRNFQFGDYAIVLLQPQQFVDRINSYLRERRITGKTGLVKYVPDDYQGVIGPFRKRDSFSYQSEWRLVVSDGPGTRFVLKIGSIEGISTIVRADEINDIVTVNF